MRVAHITHLYPRKATLHLGPFMRELNEGLSKQCDVDFYIPTPMAIPFTKRYKELQSDYEGLQNVHERKYLSIPRRKFPNFVQKNLIRAFDDTLKNETYDILHFHWAYPDILLLPYAKKLGYKVVNTFHGYNFYEIYDNPSLKPFLDNALNNTDFTITVGKQLYRDVLERYPNLSQKSTVLPNGINKNKFVIGNTLDARSKLNWQPNMDHVLTVANIGPEKGIDLLISAIAHSSILRTKRFHIIGRILDTLYYSNILRMIKEYKLNNVQLLGAVPHENLATYYQASNLFILPSRVEGFGVSLVEAGMTGLPLISTLAGGPEDIITEENGILCAKDDFRALQNAAEQFFTQQNRFDKNIIRASMVSRFSQKNIINKLIDLYNTVLNQK